MLVKLGQVTVSSVLCQYIHIETKIKADVLFSLDSDVRVDTLLKSNGTIRQQWVLHP